MEKNYVDTKIEKCYDFFCIKFLYIHLKEGGKNYESGSFWQKISVSIAVVSAAYDLSDVQFFVNKAGYGKRCGVCEAEYYKKGCLSENVCKSEGTGNEKESNMEIQ